MPRKNRKNPPKSVALMKQDIVNKTEHNYAIYASIERDTDLIRRYKQDNPEQYDEFYANYLRIQYAKGDDDAHAKINALNNTRRNLIRAIRYRPLEIESPSNEMHIDSDQLNIDIHSHHPSFAQTTESIHHELLQEPMDVDSPSNHLLHLDSGELNIDIHSEHPSFAPRSKPIDPTFIQSVQNPMDVESPLELSQRPMQPQLQQHPMDPQLQQHPMDPQLQQHPMDSQLQQHPMDPQLQQHLMQPQLPPHPMQPQSQQYPMHPQSHQLNVPQQPIPPNLTQHSQQYQLQQNNAFAELQMSQLQQNAMHVHLQQPNFTQLPQHYQSSQNPIRSQLYPPNATQLPMPPQLPQHPMQTKLPQHPMPTQLPQYSMPTQLPQHPMHNQLQQQSMHNQLQQQHSQSYSQHHSQSNPTQTISSLHHTTLNRNVGQTTNMRSLIRNNQTMQQLFAPAVNPTINPLSPYHPALLNVNHGNATFKVIDNVTVLDKLGKRFVTIDASTIQTHYPTSDHSPDPVELLNDKYLSNCLKYKGVKSKDMPYDAEYGPCMKEDCLMPFSAHDGEQCKNANCIKAKLLKTTEIYYHEECLFRFNGGNNGYCNWCIILFSLCNNLHINEKEYFTNVAYPNAEWKVKGYFKIPNAANLLKNIKHLSTKLLYRAIRDCKAWNHYCLISAQMQSDKTAYFLVTYQFLSDVAQPFRDSISEYQLSFGSQKDRQTLKDAKIYVDFPMLIYPATKVCTSKPNDFEMKRIEVVFKVPEYDQSIESGVLQINYLYPPNLAEMNGKMSIKELFNYKASKQRVHKRYHFNPYANKWSNFYGTFGMLFNWFSYKRNKSEIACAQMRNDLINSKRKKGEKRVTKLPFLTKHQYNVRQCSNTYDKTEEYREIQRRNNHFINYNLNRFIQVMANQDERLAHWKSVHLYPDKMTELLKYKSLPGRHTDKPTLFNPDINAQVDVLNHPHNGQAALHHNYVNATIDKHGNIKRSDEHEKHFCIDQIREYHWKCDEGEKNNPHFTIKDSHYAILVFSQRAAYMKPHKPEMTKKGWNSLFMTRNYFGERNPEEDEAGYKEHYETDEENGDKNKNKTKRKRKTKRNTNTNNKNKKKRKVVARRKKTNDSDEEYRVEDDIDDHDTDDNDTSMMNIVD